MNTNNLTFDAVLQLARANTAGLLWLESTNGYIRCQDGRCALEAAANTEAHNLDAAITALGLDLYSETVARTTNAADLRVARAGLNESDRGTMMMALNVGVDF